MNAHVTFMSLRETLGEVGSAVFREASANIFVAIASCEIIGNEKCLSDESLSVIKVHQNTIKTILADLKARRAR